MCSVRLPCTILCVLATLALAPAEAGGQPRPAPDTIATIRRLASATDGARIPLLLDLAEARRDDPAAVLPIADETLALLARHPSARDESRARAARAYALQGRGEYPTALTEAQRAERLAGTAGDDRVLGGAIFVRATTQWRMAAYDSALAGAQRALALFSPYGASATLVRIHSLIGAIHYGRSNLTEALTGYLAALQMGEEMGDEIAAARAHNNIGLVYLDLGKKHEAYAALQRALKIHERLGPRTNLTNTLNNIGLALIELDRPREALPYLQRALVYDTEAGNLFGTAKEYSNIGFVYERLKEPARALAYHEQAMALRERVGDKDGQVRTGGGLAEVRMQLGDTAAAIPILQKSIALALEIGDQRDAADQLSLLATAYAARGDSAAAYVAYRRFHALQAALADSASRRQTAELETRYQARERERDLASLTAVAESRRTMLTWTVVGSALLAALLVILAVLLVMRVRAQRALSESETRYRALFQSSDAPYFVLDAESQRVLDANAEARALCGDAVASGTLVAGALHPAWVGRALSRLFTGETRGSLDIDDCWSEASGRPRWTEVRASEISLGGRASLLVALRDTTARHLREEALHREDKVEALGVLAGGIAHDFNNALTAIVGHVTLARLTTGAERDEMLGHAEAAAMAASRLTKQLLAFARGGQPARRVTDVGRLLRDAVGLAGAGSHMRVDVDIPPDLWHAELDRGQFDQVVSNLVINAQQATGDGGVLRVRASNSAAPPTMAGSATGERFVRIDFEDNGNGIPEEIRHRVFDPYFTTKSGGSGLGLATAFAICRNHGGALMLESRVGSGTTFSAFFPATLDTEPPRAEPRPAPPDGAGTILVLDDEPMVRQVLTRMLRQWGYTVDEVADGADAVRCYAERLHAGRPYDLLIMDLTIPGGMGGRQALAEILKLDRSARAIVASGYSDDPTMANHRAAGFVAALAKPFERDELGRTVSAALAEVRETGRA